MGREGAKRTCVSHAGVRTSAHTSSVSEPQEPIAAIERYAPRGTSGAPGMAVNGQCEPTQHGRVAYAAKVGWPDSSSMYPASPASL